MDQSRLPILVAAMKRNRLSVRWVFDASLRSLSLVDDSNMSGINGLVHSEPAGVDGRSFFFGTSSGVGGLQTETGFFLAMKRGDVESLQSPITILVLVWWVEMRL